jgi:hypothetical protein
VAPEPDKLLGGRFHSLIFSRGEPDSIGSDRLVSPVVSTVALYMQTTNLFGWRHHVYRTLFTGVEVGYVVTLSNPGGEMAVLPANSTFLQGLEHHGDETLHICGTFLLGGKKRKAKAIYIKEISDVGLGWLVCDTILLTAFLW